MVAEEFQLFFKWVWTQQPAKGFCHSSGEVVAIVHFYGFKMIMMQEEAMQEQPPFQNTEMLLEKLNL